MKSWILLAVLLVASPVFAAPFANGTISPRYVDTSVINQTFVYTVNSLNESVDMIMINSSGAHVFTGVSDVTINGESCRPTSCIGGNVTVESNRINITFTTPASVGTTVNITFNTTTPSSYNISNFTAYVSNGNGISLAASDGTVFNTSVTTLQMINISKVEMTKGTALLNGNDYWEFKFTLAFAASQPGLVQFRMNDWLDNSNQRLNLTRCTYIYCASFRNESSFSIPGKFNVTTSYADNIGITRTSVTDFYLRMVIPPGSPPSNSWSTSYNVLFRATP
jgi:hypothetical protein